MTKILNREQIIEISFNLRGQGKVIGFTSGTFDILHAGHVDYLKKAKEQCDILIVGVNSDSSVKLYKSPDRPIIGEKERIAVVSALEMVDYVFLFDEKNNNINIEFIRPNLYIKASQYSESQLSSKIIVEKYGGKVLLIPMILDTSSSKIIDKIETNFIKNLSISFEKDKSETKCIFLDRDGVINKDIEYLHEPDKLELLPNVIEGLISFQNMGYRLAIITNQPGIGLGYYSKEDFYKVMRKMFSLFKPHNIVIDKIYFCPHSFSDFCECRKPDTKLVKQGISDMNAIIEKSYMIGDKDSDINCGKKVGLKTISIGQKLGADIYASDLLDAANQIKKYENN